jgi:hypothetical protein
MSTTKYNGDAIPSLKASLFFAVASSAICVYLHYFQRSALDWLTREDGVFEWTTAGFYLWAAILFVLAVRGLKIGRIWLAGLSLMCFMVAGEEVSWGQRVFGFDTPESLEESNVQSEFNFHNVDGLHQNIRLLGLLIVLVVFVAIPVTQRSITFLRDFYDRMEAPIAPLAAIPWALVAMGFMAAPRVFGSGTDFGLDEVGETLLSIAFFMFGWAQVVESKQRVTHTEAELHPQSV